MKPSADVAIRKRTQIAKANRTMFAWVAIASVVVSFAVVVAIFLAQKLIYNEKVLARKANTVATLQANNNAISDLKSAIRVLDTNTALSANKAKDSDQTVQVILDALPSSANSLALGASLQNKLLAGISGLSLESLTVDPVVGVETTDTTTTTTTSASTDTNGTSASEISFQFTVTDSTGTQAALKQVLVNLERSIRTINVTNVTIQNDGTTQSMTVQGHAFYQSAVNMTLTDKVVKP